MATKQQEDIDVSFDDNNGYNSNMSKRDRWTVLEPDEKAIVLAKRFARKNGFTMGKAISELIYKALKGKKDEA